MMVSWPFWRYSKCQHCLPEQAEEYFMSYSANEERLHLFLAHAELVDLVGCGPECLVHHVVGIH